MVRKGKDKELHLKQIQCYVSTGKHHESTEVSEKSGIRKACKNFEAKGIYGRYVSLSNYLKINSNCFTDTI